MKKIKTKPVSYKTVGRIGVYRRILNELHSEKVSHVYSYKLAALAGYSAAQVRRDLMEIGYTGSPVHGYNVEELLEAVRTFLDAPSGQYAALVGVGNLGRSILAFFSGRRPKLSIIAALDKDPQIFGRVIHGCRCFNIQDIEEVIRENNIDIGIITAPASEAQTVAYQMVGAGITGILNFAPARIRVPSSVYVEDIDVTVALERAAYFARKTIS